jgi:hypothetical protein
MQDTRLLKRALQYRPSGKRDRKTKEKMVRCSVKTEQANA